MTQRAKLECRTKAAQQSENQCPHWPKTLVSAGNRKIVSQKRPVLGEQYNEGLSYTLRKVRLFRL